MIRMLISVLVGADPPEDLTAPRLVLKPSGTTGHHPSPILDRGAPAPTKRRRSRGPIAPRRSPPVLWSWGPCPHEAASLAGPHRPAPLAARSWIVGPLSPRSGASSEWRG